MDDAVLEYLTKRRKGLERGIESEQRRPASDFSNNAALMSALAKSGAQIGSIGGKIADTSAVDEFVKQRQQGLDRDQARFDDINKQQENLYGIDAKVAQYLMDQKAKKEQADLSQSRFDQEMELKRQALQKKDTPEQPKFASTGKTDEQGNLILLDQFGNTKVGPKVSARTPEESATQKAGQQELAYRYKTLQTNAEKLKKLVGQYGTMEVFGPTSSEMDSLIYQMAVDYAKMVDPTSVAREGEVAAAQKYMLPIRNMGGMAYSNETAMKLINNYQKDLEARLANRELARTGDEAYAQPQITPADGQAIAAQYKDGETKVIGGKTYVRKDGKWRLQ